MEPECISVYLNRMKANSSPAYCTRTRRTRQVAQLLLDHVAEWEESAVTDDGQVVRVNVDVDGMVSRTHVHAVKHSIRRS